MEKVPVGKQGVQYAENDSEKNREERQGQVCGSKRGKCVMQAKEMQ